MVLDVVVPNFYSSGSFLKHVYGIPIAKLTDAIVLTAYDIGYLKVYEYAIGSG